MIWTVSSTGFDFRLRRSAVSRRILESFLFVRLLITFDDANIEAITQYNYKGAFTVFSKPIGDGRRMPPIEIY